MEYLAQTREKTFVNLALGKCQRFRLVCVCARPTSLWALCIIERCARLILITRNWIVRKAGSICDGWGLESCFGWFLFGLLLKLLLFVWRKTVTCPVRSLSLCIDVGRIFFKLMILRFLSCLFLKLNDSSGNKNVLNTLLFNGESMMILVL